MDAGDPATDFGEQFAGLGAVDVATHIFKHIIRDVLQGNVEIFADIVAAVDYVE